MELIAFDLTWHSWVGNLSYFILAASYVVTNMVWLRALAAVALACEIIYLYSASDKPLWVGVIWSLVFIAINVVQLILLYRERIKTRLSQAERLLRTRLFPALNDADFFYLLKISRRHTVPAETYLARQDETMQDLHIVTCGVASVWVNRENVASIGEGGLVGDVSFFTDDIATASVIAQTELEYYSLSRARLRVLMRERPSLNLAIHESIGKELAGKISVFDASRL